MILLYSINLIYVVISFTIFYYALLMLSNVSSILLLVQTRNDNETNSDLLFDYSANLLRLLTTAVIGIDKHLTILILY